MGRCAACDKVLSDFEMTRKFAESKKYVDLCNTCFKTIPNFPPVIERNDLYHEDSVELEEEVE